MKHEVEDQHRRSIRLKGYDYAQEGMYFFTICTYNRQLLFGNVKNGEMKLNKFGRVVCDEWRQSTDIRREIELDMFIVMPNHLHGIVMMTDRDVGATGGSPFPSGPSKHSLGAFIAGFKSAITTRINKICGTPQVPIWQRNYYEHVIRDEESLKRIREYILNNPAQWDLDPENPETKGDRPVAPTEDAINTHHGVSFENRR
jgi:REP element-mobilizing transposase RayT